MKRGNGDEIVSVHREKILVIAALGLAACWERSIGMDAVHNSQFLTEWLSPLSPI